MRGAGGGTGPAGAGAGERYPAGAGELDGPPPTGSLKSLANYVDSRRVLLDDSTQHAGRGRGRVAAGKSQHGETGPGRQVLTADG
ncbi:hypothetical protein Stube_52540 [Streptomyces tubercidicus]|uniref:Uncharacterized protein n=1 Tax=Streptomyces tubercidicus TaxID=47759 RepID=A0A640V0W3_9ACTN|nr:hypothetical protein Stube_52540 [Streptomyces tubercidicus]